MYILVGLVLKVWPGEREKNRVFSLKTFMKLLVVNWALGKHSSCLNASSLRKHTPVGFDGDVVGKKTHFPTI